MSVRIEMDRARCTLLTPGKSRCRVDEKDRMQQWAVEIEGQSVT